MSDFAQNGAVCTLQQLNDTHLQTIATDWLPAAAASLPVTLILPCHAPDLASPALLTICRALSSVGWLDEVLIPINGLARDQLGTTQRFFSKNLQAKNTLLLTDHPANTRILAAAARLPESDLPQGKGLNVWASIGLLCAREKPGIFALQDCDVISFSAQTLARLCFAAVDPELRFNFAKMYYSRATDRLYGRVSRLFLAPLLHALIRVAGHHPLLDFLLSFRYPLSGECALRAPLAAKLPMNTGWALEIGMLSDVFRELNPTEICQVDGGSGYDHKHQPAAGNLTRMCSEIASSLLHHLATEGCEITPSFLQSVSRAFLRESDEAVRRSTALSRMNGLPEVGSEEKALSETFARCIPNALPKKPTPLPPWNSVASEHLQQMLDFEAQQKADH